MSNYRKTMSQALQEMYPINEDNIDLMRKAAGGAAQTVKMKDGKLKMDMFTASAIMQILDKVNPANKKKMTDMINKGTKDGMMKLQDFAMKQVKSENDPAIEEEVDLDEADDFKPHMMYDPKTGKGYKADTMDDHLRMKKMGYTHDAPKTEEVELDEAKYTRKLMKDKSVVDYVKSQQARNRKKEQGYEHGANWVELAAKTVGMEKMSLSKKKAFDWESEYEAVAKKLGEEVDLDEGKLKDLVIKGQDLEAYAKKSGGIDKKDMMKVAAMLKKGDKSGALKYAKALDTDPRDYILDLMGEEVELDEAKQVLAHGGKGKYKVVNDGSGSIDVMFKGKSVGKGDYDRGAGSFFMSIKGEKGQKSFDDAQAIADYFAKNKITEEVDLEEGKMSQLHQMIKDKKSAEEIAKAMKVDVKTIKSLMSSYESTDGDTMGENGKYMEMLAAACGGGPVNIGLEYNPMDESAASDARRAMSRDKDFSRKDSADDDDDATDDDVKGASKNIIMQMRKAQSLNGRFPVEFADKKKVKIPAKMAIAVQQKYNAMKKPADKEKFQTRIGKSYKDMLSALKEELQPKKESILERMNRKIKENKDG